MPRILVVEDEPDARWTLAELLRSHGYDVDEAEDGAAALERLRGGPPVAVVVCDLGLPVMDGPELIERMRADPALSAIPVVVVTGHILDLAAVPDCVALLKPVDVAQLMRVVRDLAASADR